MMTFRLSRSLRIGLLPLALSTLPATAPIAAQDDFSVRECIQHVGIPGKAWVLPPSSGWKAIGRLIFNTTEDGDMVVSATVGFHEGNSAGTEVQYRLSLDGVPFSVWTRRVPAGYPTSQVFRQLIGGVLEGEHTLEIEARNLSAGSQVRYSWFWISPLIVPVTEVTVATQSSTAIAVGTSWVTVLTLTPSIPSDRYAFLSAFLTIGATGSSDRPILYRIVRDGQELSLFEDSVPNVRPDGNFLAYIDSTPPSNPTYEVQVRVASSGSINVVSRSLALQTVPEVTLFENSATGISIPADQQFHEIVPSVSQYLMPSSVGAWGSNGYGFAHGTYEGLFNSEALWKLEFHNKFVPWTFEVGVVHVHGTPVGRELESLMSDWEQLGTNLQDAYGVSLNAAGLCQGTTPLALSRASYQVLAVPDDNPYVPPYVCNPIRNNCCNQHPTICTAYVCEPSGQLALGNAPGTNCPITQ